MNNFFKLIEQFRTQDEPAYCGLASLAMTLNTLNIDPRRTWKGPWRWFHEEMLDCCHPLPKVREEGITLTQAACLARCNGARVELYPYGSVGLAEFRAMVAEACHSAEEHIIVSYSRKEFLQTGDGHFSPIGGYSAKEDLVLILDTARFKYPPHWVPLEMLHNAMARIDPATGRPRGFMRMGRHPRLDSVLFTLDVRDEHWRQASRYTLEHMAGVVAAAAAAPGATAQGILTAAACGAPAAALRKFIAVRTAGSSTHGGVCIQTAAVHTFLRELRGTPLFAAC
ncbi:Glutathione gamma-glutamylcysteinyltransferase 1 [Chlorella sorokiniana]|uniref:glutathione gamma-glutamylcysteinyltransferase n=1 Tax=Chlorella sorokiniana TaxID=3076 RepID=A0A2P6U3Y8_CHLSO|nr:Glutathione gamma-glutamylcysteinyltransferase 1 [Chlorella sorokiniana]|eukprot:PRW61025.1 Glutathione gamma-glutamylcysteinyltransferase 1 [Chlorella sorokiniana]